MKKPRKHRPAFFHAKAGTGLKPRIIGAGIPIKPTKIINSGAKGKTGKAGVQAGSKRLKSVSGYVSPQDFLAVFSRPDKIGSKGFITFHPKTIIEKGRTLRLILINGVVVPFQHRRKGIRIGLHSEVIKTAYEKFGALVKEGNFFIQTQISISDKASLNSLTKRLGYAIFHQFPEQGVIVLRKKLDSVEMKQVLGK